VARAAFEGVALTVSFGCASVNASNPELAVELVLPTVDLEPVVAGRGVVVCNVCCVI
jgi:hypothetical protein